MTDVLLRELRQAARSMRRAPGVSTAVVLTLALGIGASTAIFSLAYGVLFRPLPYRDAERLVVIRMERVVEGTGQPARAFFPFSTLTDLRAGTQAFESMAFYSTERSQLFHKGFAHTVDSASVSDSFFSTVGGRLQAGRWLGSPDEDRTSVVISERLRQRLFGTEDAVGQPLTIGGQGYQIAGVAHRTFQFPTRETDVWLPVTEAECCPYAAVARLGPGVPHSRAEAEVNAVIGALAPESPRVYGGASASVVFVRDELLGDVRTALLVLLASVGLLLAVACANTANLLIARNAGRSRETAIRVALGASRERLILQSLAEAGLAVTAGGAIGLLLAAGLIDTVMAFGPAGLPRLDADAVRIDRPVSIFVLAIAAAVTAVLGLLPAVRLEQAIDSIRTGAPGLSAGPGRRRLQNALVVVQLAVSVVLLVGASLLGRSLVTLMTTDLGVRTDGVATAAIHLSHGRRLTDAQQLALTDAILERIGALPDVQAAGAGASLPPNASTSVITLKRSGDTVDYQAVAVPATPGYFGALRVQLLKGRLFSEADREGQQEVMIMTADTARRFFDVEDPIGQTMTLPVLRNGVGGRAEMTLVGVISNVKYSGLQAAPDDVIYRPLRQQPWSTLFVVARTSGEPSALASQLRHEITAIDPAVAISSVNTLDAIVATEAAQPRFRSAVLAALAAFALAIASVGLYGVVAHGVSQRTGELGVRMALGASRMDVLMLVLLQGVRLAGAGLALGVAGALATTWLLAGLLYGTAATDAVSFGAAAGVLVLVAAGATYLPAHRAARLDPVEALRAE